MISRKFSRLLKIGGQRIMDITVLSSFAWRGIARELIAHSMVAEVPRADNKDLNLSIAGQTTST